MQLRGGLGVIFVVYQMDESEGGLCYTRRAVWVIGIVRGRQRFRFIHASPTHAHLGSFALPHTPRLSLVLCHVIYHVRVRKESTRCPAELLTQLEANANPNADANGKTTSM